VCGGGGGGSVLLVPEHKNFLNITVTVYFYYLLG
jgi:hypothetical protein